jgi:hypothetical protein
MVAHRYRGNPRAHTLDHGARLMSQDAREEALWVGPLPGVDIGVA